VADKATISHRGEKYEIGRGKRFYGIWVVGAPYEAPVDRWPETRDGWEQAWTRFAAIETLATIAPVQRQRAGLGSLLNRGRGGQADAATDAGDSAGGDSTGDGSGTGGAALGVAAAARRGGTALLAGEGLLVLGVVLGLAGLFPAYTGGQSLLSEGDQVVPHLCYVIAWAVSAGLIALGVARQRTAKCGALLGLGLSAVTFGLFLTDVGEVTSGRASLGSGLVVSLLGWLACTAGAALALVAAGRDAEPTQAGLADAGLGGPGGPARPAREHAGPLALLVLAGIGTVAAFAPSWDSYTLTSAAAGTVQTITRGNAFDSPGVVIAGNVAVMVAVVGVAVLAALWRPSRQGALLLAGAIVPLAAQAVSALIQVSEPATAAMFEISQAQATAVGLTITSGVTPIFWVYCVFVISLAISCAWLMTAPGHPGLPAMPAIRAIPVPPWAPVPGGDSDQVRAGDSDQVRAGDSDEVRGGDSDEVPGGAAGAPVSDDGDGGGEGGEESAYA